MGNTSLSESNLALQIFITGAYGSTPLMLIQTNNTVYGGGEELVLNFGLSIVANNVFINTYSGSTVFPTYAGLAFADPEPQSSPIQFLNNDIFKIGPPQDGGCPTGPGALSVDPAFRNPEGGYFREQDRSPLIAKGDISAPLIPPADLDQKSRTVCGTIDIGAYELRPHPPITLTSSANPTPGGSTLTFTAKLSGNCNLPTEIVTFLDAGVPLGTATIDGSGTATLSIAFLVVGQHNITAAYSGDFNFESNTSAVLVQIITGDPTATTLRVTPSGSRIRVDRSRQHSQFTVRNPDRHRGFHRRGEGPNYGSFVVACLLPLVGLWRVRLRGSILCGMLLSVAALAAFALLQGCRLPGTYSMTVTGTDAAGRSLNHRIPVILVITK